MTVLFLSGYEHDERCIKIKSPAAYEVRLIAENSPIFGTLRLYSGAKQFKFIVIHFSLRYNIFTFYGF